MRKSDIDGPALVVDLDAMERNIKSMAQYARDANVSLRPMTKTHKCPAISHMQIAAGSKGIQVAKLSEGEVMEAYGVKDIFVSNEIIGPKKIDRLLRLAKRADVIVSVDSVVGARDLSKYAATRETKLKVRVDIDTGLGRTGVLPGKPALELAREVSKLQGLLLEGIFTHEGGVYRAKGSVMLEQLTTKAAQDMVDTANLIRSEGIGLETVSMGSTPGAKVIGGFRGVTEMRPGAYVFNDVMQYSWYGVCKEEDCALTVLTTVISAPSDDRVISDAGSKSAGPDACGFGTFRPAEAPPGVGIVRREDGEIINDAIYDSTIGEEYGLIKMHPASGLKAADVFKIGDRLEVVPLHCCGTVMLSDNLVGIRDGEVEVTWPISARGKFT